MITLRPYQQALIDQTRASLKSGHRSPLLVSPCGSGKTVMFSFFAKEISLRDKRTLILAHRDELIDQISETLSQFQVPHSFIAAGRPFRRSMVHVASVFSVARRLNKIPIPDIIIIDEAHHAIHKSTWSRIFDHFPNAKKIGVTASPTRLSGEPLGDVFDDMILGPSVDDLVKLGALCPYKIYIPSTIQTDNVHTRMGDFARKELAVAADTPTITGDAINEYRKYANGKRAIVFCVSVEHAKHVASKFKEAGYRAVCVDGSMDRALRRDIVQSFKKGGTDVLTSCDLVSEGFDLPAIEVAIMLRPTQSLALWIQQSGRALRPSPGKEMAIILDHAGNCLRHGLPDEIREWTLGGKRKSKKGSEPNIKVKTCPKCFAAQLGGGLVCKFCSYVFESASREVAQVEGELVEADPVALRRERKREEWQAQSLEDLVKLGRQRGYKFPYAWARYRMQARRAA